MGYFQNTFKQPYIQNSGLFNLPFKFNYNIFNPFLNFGKNLSINQPT